jgi:hypothetical protein
MKLHSPKLDHFIVGNPLLVERILVNERIRFLSGFDSSDDDSAGPWHPGSGNEQFFCAIPPVEKFAASRCDAFNLFNGNFVFEKEKEYRGSKLTEAVGLTSNGRDRAPSRPVFPNRKVSRNRTSRSSSLPFVYQENIPRPATGSGFIAAGAV